MSTTVPAKSQQGAPERVGGWLPPNSNVLLHWVRKFVEDVDKKSKGMPKIPFGGAPLYTPAVRDLQTLIESTAELRMLASAMFDEVPDKEPYKTDPVGNRQIRSYSHMLTLFSTIMTGVAPEWSKFQAEVGLIGFPFNAILDWPMATPSGYAFFLKAEVNEKLKAILNGWRDDVLMTSKSQYVLTMKEDGWLSPEALTTIMEATGEPDKLFQDLFNCDTKQDHWGFKSWDDFFVRKFRNIDVDRPVGEKADPRWVVNSCESHPFSLQTNVKGYDTFWLKGQPYSVIEMMGHHEKASEFIGGTVYQAFLSAMSYHRWNSPVKGKVVYASVINGTYFSEPTITGFTNPEGPDPAAPDMAQGYITHVATRAMYLFEADAPVGLMCAIYVGMADVSTCEIGEKFKKARPDNPVAVEKGEEIGMFHHGGSTHCLLFPAKLKLQWVFEAFPEAAEKNIPIRGKLAYVDV
ncbi:Phophatidylserine decarboxylase-domain-containing protein [Annulohypoxylon bovei var. microspora]|nr:Phophatidylserine decarboxylase-domain-containing protein [Annulohypoxylon bovei var. microspora]